MKAKKNKLTDKTGFCKKHGKVKIGLWKDTIDGIVCLSGYYQVYSGKQLLGWFTGIDIRQNIHFD